MSNKILVVEDDSKLRRLICLNLRGEGYEALEAEDAPLALALTKSQRPDLLILDLSLPSFDGLVVCETLRTEPDYPDCSILILTARGRLEDKGDGYRHGADDYLLKPFDMQELLWRTKALLLRPPRRSQRPSEPISLGRFTLLPDSSELATPHERIRVTPLEAMILQILMEAEGQVISQEELAKGIWNQVPENAAASIRMHINRIRQRLEPNPALPKYLLTIRGRGYRLLAP